MIQKATPAGSRAAGLLAPERAQQRRNAALQACIVLAAIVAAAFAVRMSGLGARTFSHPENFISGIPMPDWVSPAGRRVDLKSLFRGTLADGHPPLYFAAMLVWTKIFGTGLVALRLPSAILGTLSIPLLYLVARREGGRRVALIAAGLLALNGFHIYQSQLARMYAPAAFLILLSTVLLHRVLERGRLRDGAGYAAATTAALWTHVYCWPAVFAQILWSTFRCVARGERPRALVPQAIAVIVSLPVLSLSIYQDPPTEWREPQWTFIEFGHLFPPLNDNFWGGRPDLLVPHGVLAFAAIAFVVLGLRAYAGRPAPPSEPAEPAAHPRVGRWLLPCAAFVSMCMAYFGIAFGGLGRGPEVRDILAAVAVLPMLIALLLPYARRTIDRLATRPPRWIRAARSGPAERASLWLAFLPIALMLGVSLIRPSLVMRGTLVFTPFYLVAVAHGVDALTRRHRAGLLVLAALVFVHGSSVRYVRAAEAGPRDYAGLAEAMRSSMGDDDLFFVGNNFASPPLLYYFPVEIRDRFLNRDYPELLQKAGPHSGVWAVSWTGDPATLAQMVDALRGYIPVDTVEVRAATAYRFVRSQDAR